MKQALAILAAALVLSACSTSTTHTAAHSAPPKHSWDVSGHMAD